MRAGWAAAALLLAVAGCSGATAPPDRPAEAPAVEVDDLLGRTFSSVSVTVDDKPFPLLAGTELRVDFELTGLARVQAGCNITEGDVDLVDDRLDFTGVRGTDMACLGARGRQDDWMGEVFAASPEVRLDGTRLTLATADTTILLGEAASPNRPLDRTRWSVTAFHDGEGPAETQPAPKLVLAFSRGKVEASAGCHSAMATYTADGNTIRFGELIRTDAACAGPTKQAKQALFDVLRGEVRYVAGESLVLRQPSGAGLSGYEITVR